MKYFLKTITILFIFSVRAEDLIFDSRGYYQNDEIVMQDGNKLVHYQSKGNWSDNVNNYGKFKCKGSLLINKSGKRSDKELILCELEDVNGEYFWNIPKRSNSEWEAGVGSSTIISATQKYEKLIGKTEYNLTPKQIEGRSFSRSLYIVEDVKKGELVSENNIRSIRPGYGLHPKYLKEILNKKFKKDLKKGTRLSLNQIT